MNFVKLLMKNLSATDFRSWLAVHFPETSAVSLHLTAVVLLHSARIDHSDAGMDRSNATD